MKKIIFSTLCAFALVGCGGPDPKNIEDQAKYKEELQAAKTSEGRLVIESKYCDYGWRDACYNAAINAPSVYDDKKEKVKKHLEFLEKACDLEHARGCGNLGDYYARRNTSWVFDFIDKENIDMKKAVSYYEKYYELSNNNDKQSAFGSLGKAYKKANMMDKFKNLYDKNCPEGPGNFEAYPCYYLMKN